MATITDSDVQAAILRRIGDFPAGGMDQSIAANWDLFADKALIAPRLQELYTQRTCLDELLGGNFLADQVDNATDGALNLKLEQRSEHRRLMRAETEAEIVRIETRTRAVRPPAVRPLTHTEIETPPITPPVRIDANSPAYHGDPYVASRGVGR